MKELLITYLVFVRKNNSELDKSCLKLITMHILTVFATTILILILMHTI